MSPPNRPRGRVTGSKIDDPLRGDGSPLIFSLAIRVSKDKKGLFFLAGPLAQVPFPHF